MKRVCFPALIGLLFLAPFGMPAESERLPAFPGAEGFGRFATGGRGGSVYHVTNLNDSGPGSFRDAVSRPNRTVVFEVAGVIPLKRRVQVAPNLTIAGQTAPGEGITLYGNGVSFSGANHAIVRHLRFRMGADGDLGRDAVAIAHGHDMIFDHLSVSWGRDENFSINGPVTNVTIQDCIIAQGLQPHSAGGLIQTAGGVSILRSLYIDNHTRNPKVKGVNQYVNNVIYNWGGGGAYILGDSEGTSYANVVNNCFIHGPDTTAPGFSRGNVNFQIYAVGNVQDPDRDGRFNPCEFERADYGVVAWREEPFPYPPVEILPVEAALERVTAQAGASLRRDAIDQRLIAELLSFGRSGQIITNESAMGWTDRPGTAEVSQWVDTDRDGMPDSWEAARGLNRRDPEDRNHRASSGYTQLEEYLHWRARPHAITARNQTLQLDLRPWLGPAGEGKWVLSGARDCEVVLVADGRTVRVTPRSGFVGQAAFRISNGNAVGRDQEVSVLVYPADPFQP